MAARSRVPLCGKEKLDDDENFRDHSVRRLKQTLQQRPASFYFMVATFLLLLLNLYVSRTKYEVKVSYIHPEDTSNVGEMDLNIERPRQTSSAPMDQDDSDGTTDYGDEGEQQEAGTPNFEHEYRNEDAAADVREDTWQAAQNQQSLRGNMPQQNPFAVPFPNLMELSDEELFENYEEYAAAPDVFVPSFPAKRNEWWAVQNYVRLYQKYPIKRFIPILSKNIQINQDTFTQRFRRFGQPLLLRFDNLRKAGFSTRSYTFDELRAMFPFDASMSGKTFSQYRPNAKFDSEVDLGPGLAAIAEDGKIVRKNGLRNFPRNMKVKTESLQKLGVQWPPLIPSRWRQRPSLWMGTSTSGTAFHSDCCDNFIVMISGTKRITLAPPSDFHLLSPRCVGKNKGLCYANIPEPNQPGVSSTHYNKMIVDVKPGEILWLPAGWFHHIENLGPTLMYNTWSFGEQTAGVVSCNKGWQT